MSNLILKFYVFICVYIIGFIVTTTQLIKFLFMNHSFKSTTFTDVKQRKVALVTGGTSGIGFAIVEKLSALNYVVIAPVVHLPLNPIIKVDYIQLDLSDISSVKKTSFIISKKYSKLDLMINCAGVMFVPLRYTSLQLEEHFVVNYLGHFFLTVQCMNLLNSAPSSRIINVTSSLHWLGEANISTNITSPAPRNYSRHLSYASSKLCLLLFTGKLARSVIDTSVSVVAYDPGTVQTDLYRHTDWFTSTVVQLLGKVLLRSPADAADDIMHLADIELPQDSPCFLGWLGRFGPCSSVARDSALQDKLWNTSIELTGARLSQCFW